MKKICFINQKGGVGKTTSVINLSASLASDGAKTLIIDMDPQANSTVGVGIEPENVIGPLLLGKIRASDAVRKTEIENLHIIPSHLELDSVKHVIHEKPRRETLLQRAIEKDLDYDYIVIDLGPSLDDLAFNAVNASDLSIVPLDLTKFALVGLENVIDFIITVKEDNDYGKYIKLLLNKYDSRKKSANEWFLDEIAEYNNILKTIIHMDSMTEHAHASELPVLHVKKNSKAGKDFLNLAEEIKSIWP